MPDELGPRDLFELIQQGVAKLREKEARTLQKPKKRKRPSRLSLDIRDHQVIHAQLGGNAMSSLQDLLPGQVPAYQAIQIDLIIQHERDRMVRTRMEEILSTREMFVIVNRVGMNGGDPMTLQQIGDSIHLSRERIRQIEGDAVKILKGDRRMRELA